MIHSMTAIHTSSGHHRRGPPFLQNVTRQAVSEYYQIYMNRNLTKAQIQTAVGNWSTTYNVAVSSIVNADDSQYILFTSHSFAPIIGKLLVIAPITIYIFDILNNFGFSL